MKPMYIVLLIVVVVAGGWFVAKDKRVAKQTDNSGEQVVKTAPTDPSSGVSQTTTSAPSAGNSAAASTTMTLTISSPTDGTTVTSASVVIKGKTRANAEVFVNDVETKADANGNFSVTLTLDEGDNPIVVSANDADGNVAEKELIVYYNAS